MSPTWSARRPEVREEVEATETDQSLGHSSGRAGSMAGPKSYLVAHPRARKWVITPVIYMG